ncbi:MAG: hypothetical protein GYB66_05010 [Chloroflexi bacterium]|nr:hypothetical protein [Chloroflexota bacterium]
MSEKRTNMPRWMLLGSIIVGLAILGAGVTAVVLIGQSVPTDDPAPLEETNNDSIEAALPKEEALRFPRIAGTDLAFREVVVPLDLEAGPKLIVVSYDDTQQPLVDEWLAPLESLNNEHPTLSGYYVPLLPKDAASSAAFIIGGMSAVAENDRDRARTVVVFTNVDGFNRLLEVPDKDTVQLFLLDGNHQVRWRESGAYSADKIADLATVLDELLQNT